MPLPWITALASSRSTVWEERLNAPVRYRLRAGKSSVPPPAASSAAAAALMATVSLVAPSPFAT